MLGARAALILAETLQVLAKLTDVVERDVAAAAAELLEDLNYNPLVSDNRSPTFRS